MTFNPLDPDKMFVTNALTRQQICDSLNDYLAAKTESNDHALDATDPRLTDDFCQMYADFIGDLDPDWSEDSQEEAIQQMQFEALTSIGAMPQEEPKEEPKDTQLYLVSDGSYTPAGDPAGLQQAMIVEGRAAVEEAAERLIRLKKLHRSEIVVNPLGSPISRVETT